MNPPPLFMNPKSYFMSPGAISFIPGWIWLLMVVFTVGLLFPRVFNPKKTDTKISNNLINPYFLAFIIGSLMPAFDDLLAFVFGPPFAHHSLFHSLFGSLITLLIFRGLSTPKVAIYAFFGNLTHTTFNFYLDTVTPFFPFIYQEWGLTHITKVNTYWLKVIHYPLILVLFGFSILKYYRKNINK